MKKIIKLALIASAVYLAKKHWVKDENLVPSKKSKKVDIE